MNLKKILKTKLPYLFEIYCFFVMKWQSFCGKRMLQKDPERFVGDLYEKGLHKKADLENPKTFNEKLNWLKINWFDDRALSAADKFEVRQFVESKGLGHLLNELYGVWEDPADIDFDALPDHFVLKSSHDSGHLILVKDKAQLNKKLALFKMRWWLKNEYCFISGEWPYFTNKPYIVCERFLEDSRNDDLYDYKFFCFNGEPEYVFFCSDRKNSVKADFYDMDWKKQDFRWHYPNADMVAPRPQNFEKMKEYARTLAKDFPFVRVDFYEVDGKVYFGELTFFHGGGRGEFNPDETDTVFGEKITLPEKKDPWGYVFEQRGKKK